MKENRRAKVRKVLDEGLDESLSLRVRRAASSLAPSLQPDVCCCFFLLVSLSRKEQQQKKYKMDFSADVLVRP